ncbi:hypothetical protein [Prosthecobacter sp.]|uniref:hypothetical protein n=1 Tax=Prosthecobacter sp. TaxID=1965333 RepID=UPI0037838B89
MRRPHRRPLPRRDPTLRGPSLLRGEVMPAWSAWIIVILLVINVTRSLLGWPPLW